MLILSVIMEFGSQSQFERLACCSIGLVKSTGACIKPLTYLKHCYKASVSSEYLKVRGISCASNLREKKKKKPRSLYNSRRDHDLLQYIKNPIKQKELNDKEINGNEIGAWIHMPIYL